jgi:predicted ATP-grasp superfamily ATP-dependent carboligase
MNRVLVTDAGERNVPAVIRSLGKKGVEITCSENTRVAMGFFSKYCQHRLISPSPKTEMVIPTSDEAVYIASKNKELIEKHTKIPVPVFNTFSKAADKAQTLKIAIQQQVPCPKTFFIKDLDEVKKAGQELGFPLVIKPKVSYGSRGIVYVKSEDEFIDSYLKVHSKYKFPMIQEYIRPGGQACGAFLLFNKDSEPRAFFAHKRLREFPVKGGPSTLRESVYRPDLIDMSVKILKAMKWYGIAMVEFKQDPADNQFKIMEINPRFWGSLQLSVLAGVDFPYLLYKMEMDGDIEPVASYKEGIRCRWLLPGDILHFIFNPKRFELKPGFFNFSKNNRQDDFISLKDPGPTFGFFLAVIKNLFNLDKWRDVFKR